VQEDVGERLGRDLRSVDLDPVSSLHEGGETHDFSIDRHAPGADQLLGTPARGDAGPAR
jgi:hypothetical protein